MFLEESYFKEKQQVYVRGEKKQPKLKVLCYLQFLKKKKMFESH